MQATTRPGLVRALGRWDWTALVVNAIIGSGIFGLPAALIALVGGASPLAFLVAGAGIGVIVVCFAEVSARFTEAGGPYLYAREAFGRFAGLQIGWVTWLVRIASAAANANLFVLYLGELWPPARAPVVALLLLTLLFGLLAAINYRGVRQGALVSDVFALAKLLPLAVFALAGLFFVRGDYFQPAAGAGWTEWSQALLLLVFAYGGFETALIPAGEGKDPKRDAPVALLTGLAVVTVFYVLVQVVAQGTLPPGVETERPLATAAREFLGSPGAVLLSVGAMVSTYGLLSGNLLSVPRLTFALGERGDFPAFFAAVHPRFRTPHLSILVFAVVSWGLAGAATLALGEKAFQWNATLSAVARLLTYGSTCGALLVFRRRGGDASAFQAPAGGGLALLGIAFCLVLLLRMGWAELLILGVTAGLACATWLWARRRTAPLPA